MQFVIPVIFLAVFAFAIFKKVKVYDEFSAGVGEAVKFTVSLVPCLCAIFMMCEIFEASGLADAFTGFLSPAFGFLGIPPELTKLILVKPVSGSGSLAYLTDVIETYGADSYIARCACVCFGSSETVFYISAVYFAGTKNKKIALPIALVLISTFITTVLACLLCRIM